MKKIDLNLLFDAIRNHADFPVPESVLLERFFPDAREIMIGSPGQQLFDIHFTLYHHLYLLADELAGSEYFLFIRSMYIYLLTRPAPEHCSWFDAGRAVFCGVETAQGEPFCAFHRERESAVKNAGTLSFSSLRNYYLDPGNLNPEEANRMANLSRGILRYGASGEEVERSLDLLGIDIDCSVDRLKRRFRYLSKRYHPDTCLDDMGDFRQMRQAYSLLLRLKTEGDAFPDPPG